MHKAGRLTPGGSAPIIIPHEAEWRLLLAGHLSSFLVQYGQNQDVRPSRRAWLGSARFRFIAEVSRCGNRPTRNLRGPIPRKISTIKDHGSVSGKINMSFRLEAWELDHLTCTYPFSLSSIFVIFML